MPPIRSNRYKDLASPAVIASVGLLAFAALSGCSGTASRGWAQTADAIEPNPIVNVRLGIRDGDVDSGPPS